MLSLQLLLLLVQESMVWMDKGRKVNRTAAGLSLFSDAGKIKYEVNSNKAAFSIEHVFQCCLLDIEIDN